MIKKAINGKYFYHVILAMITLIVIYIVVNRIVKKKQFSLLMLAIDDNKTQGGGYSDLKFSDAFSSNYYKGKTVEPLWDSTAEIISKIYNKGSSFLNPVDNESAIVALFKRFESKRQVSYISDKFNAKYNKDLYSFLNSFMSNQIIGERQLGSTNYMVQINQIVTGLKA